MSSLASTTVGSSNADASEFLDESDPWDDDDLYVVGPQFQFQNFSVPLSHGDNLLRQDMLVKQTIRLWPKPPGVRGGIQVLDT